MSRCGWSWKRRARVPWIVSRARSGRMDAFGRDLDGRSEPARILDRAAGFVGCRGGHRGGAARDVDVRNQRAGGASGIFGADVSRIA